MKKIEKLPPNPWLEQLKEWKCQIRDLIAEQKLTISHSITELQTLQVISKTENPATHTEDDGFTQFIQSYNLPQIHVSTCKGTNQYYMLTETSPKKRKYISKSNQKEIKKILQLSYDIRALNTLKNELNMVTKFLCNYAKQNSSTLFQKLPLARKVLITPVTLPDDEYKRKWQEIEYHRKPITANTPEFYTNKGERVRSKSEILIANTLNQWEIPYRYEYPVTLKQFTAHPDFYCLNLRTRHEYLWEHLGLMDNSQYSSNSVQKILEYEKCGFFPGHNLILTFETAELPLSIKQVQRTIKEYLV